jgi:hypothetical protein
MPENGSQVQLAAIASSDNHAETSFQLPVSSFQSRSIHEPTF